MSRRLTALIAVAAIAALGLLALPKDNAPQAAVRSADTAAPMPTSIEDLVPAPLVADPSGDVAQGIDVTGVSFKQRGVEIELRVETTAPVKLEDLNDGLRSLCVLLTRKSASSADGQLCLTGNDDEARAIYSTVGTHERPRTTRRFAVAVRRPNSTTLVTSFRPESIDLVRERFVWQITATTSTGACSAEVPCIDFAPDLPAQAQTESLAVPRCFGANARPERGKCTNGALRLTVIPTPDDAQLQPNAYCRLTNRRSLLSPCFFGYEGAKPAGNIALIGDSHAVHWRGAVTQLANRMRWIGVTLALSGCRFSAEPPTQPDRRARRDCRTVRKRIYRWLERHPEVHTVFIGNHIGGFGHEPAYSRAARGAARAIDRLPKSVKRVIVIRDVPQNPVRTIDCVNAAIRDQIPPGPACAVQRTRAVKRDPTVRGVQISKRKRVHSIDLISRFCSARFCLPVIGGALVHKDEGHITNVYSNSLGAAFMQRYDQIVRNSR